MMRSLLFRLSALGSVAALACSAGFLACSDSGDQNGGPDAGDDVTADDVAPQPDAGPQSASCSDLGLPTVPFSPGPYGANRGDIADDFTVPLVDGTTWDFKQSFTGCESYIFLPDILTVSALDTTSIWTKDKDLAALLKASPKNVHYFFVSLQGSDANAQNVTSAMQQRVDTLLGGMSDADAAQWRPHLHVVATRGGALGNWVGQALTHHAVSGLAIDRFQRIRDVGQLADVTRFDQSLQDANQWPWQNNIAYAAYEADYMNAQADQQEKLDAEGATVVKLWDGQVLSEFAETDVQLPTAQQMKGFDTLEVEVTSACPTPSVAEFQSCGAWDYIASLGVAAPSAGGDAGTDGGDAGDGGAPAYTEIARFITSYHRETHWVVDATPMLALLRDGGMRHFRWDFAPSWNKQPTATTLSLRFSNKKKGYTPEAITPLFTGGAFNENYNVGRTPATVPIPADATRVELWTIVTGHGNDASSCSEFCDHQHELTVNGTKYDHDFPMAGSSDKCVPNWATGMVPNQGGTWWFGRGGWCPGWQVDPWAQDVTKDVTPGQDATVTYKGMFNNAEPPTGGSGNIDLNSYLVAYH